MRHRKPLYMLLLAVVMLMSSCKSDGYDDVTLYNDAAILSFSLGTLNRYVDGVKSTVTGSNYSFQINQHVDETLKTRVIENCDSLPMGTDASHVLCTISVMNNGWVGIRDLEDPDLMWSYSSTDSIDFSVPRKLVVYSSSGIGSSDYTVKVNVHKEKGDTMVWKLMDGAEWPSQADTPVLPAGIKQVIGRSTTEWYALSDDGKLKVSYDNMLSWEDDLLENEADAAFLPTTDISIATFPMWVAENVEHVLMAGNSKTEKQVGDGSVETVWHSRVWRKLLDYEDGAPRSRWVYIEREENDPYQLPVLSGLTLIQYGDSFLAFGGDYRKVYVSRDKGITWKVSKYVTMPADFDYATTGVQVVLDDDNFIWLYCKGTGQVWRGRLNRMGWENQWSE